LHCRHAAFAGYELYFMYLLWPVLFDAFADEFTGIDGIYALRDAFPDHIDVLGSWARSRQGTDRPLKALGEIAS
jgi:hypothetical protein